MKITLLVVGASPYLDYTSLDVVRKLQEFDNVDSATRMGAGIFEVDGVDLDNIVGINIPLASSYLTTSRIHESAIGGIITNWDVFEDRAKSLLDRWSKFAKANPERSAGDSISGFLTEIDDSYTKFLKED